MYTNIRFFCVPTVGREIKKCTKLKMKLEDTRLMRFPCVIASFIHTDCDLFVLCFIIIVVVVVQ